jgi:hypothetical protein
MTTPRYLAIANPDSLRWRAYATALQAYWQTRGVDPHVTVLPWREVVPREGNLDGLPAFDAPAIVRLESPGRDWDVTKLLLQAGCRATGEEDHFGDLSYRKGELVRPGLFNAGFRRVLEGLQRAFDVRPHLHLTAWPSEVAEMFDKNATAARLSQAGIPVPASLEWRVGGVEPPLLESSSANRGGSTPPARLLDELRRWDTAYVKLNTGSSASAIAVVRPRVETPYAISTIVRMDGAFWSSRRLQRHTGDDLDAILAFLLREGVCVQQGIRMATIDGDNFDVRVVMIHGQPAFTIFRLSHHPMTNLHLGGRRGDETHCRAAIPTRAWLDAMDHCLETAQLYKSVMVGIDLLFEQGYRKHYILEVNAFGDFFPDLVDAQGRSVHHFEIAKTWDTDEHGSEPRTK